MNDMTLKRCKLAHEINNKLAIITAQCDLLLEQKNITSEDAKQLSEIKKTAFAIATRLNSDQCRIFARPLSLTGARPLFDQTIKRLITGPIQADSKTQSQTERCRGTHSQAANEPPHQVWKGEGLRSLSSPKRAENMIVDLSANFKSTLRLEIVKRMAQFEVLLRSTEDRSEKRSLQQSMAELMELI